MNIRTIVKAFIPKKLFKSIEPTGHLIETMIMNVRYGFPGRKIRAIGVTGTNGKTSTTLFIYRMLSEAGVKAAFMSTVASGSNGEVIPSKVHMTTSKASVVQSRLKKYADEGVEWVVIETSSHGLAQNRLWGIPFEVAVITNLTHDHLEYHGTFEKYREAKRRLFKMASTHGLKAGAVNADDPSADVFAKTVEHPVTYGIKSGDLRATNIKLSKTGSTYTVKAKDATYNIKVAIPGEFNVSNSLAALSVGRILGLSKAQIEKGIAKLDYVEGRMNRIEAGQKFQVIVDFASTPDGYERFFSSVRPLVKGKLVAVFGSAGERDESKRAEQGKIAARYADEVIVTEEDDRSEDGLAILQQIAEGAEQEGKVRGDTLHLIHSREEAIGFAMMRVSNKEDMVVLLGKGHEKTIERADGEYPWDESEAARAALKALKQD